MKINPKDFGVVPNKIVKLEKRPTLIHPFYESKKHYHRLMEENSEELSALQSLLYASDRYALLLIFQGMDAAGKDGIIRHVLYGVNPQGCEVFSFKQPSHEELEHDFLWRTTCRLPERGRIGVFNRSYYEDVIIVRVHPKTLLRQDFYEESQNDKNFWEKRYSSIVDFERHLFNNRTRTIKFFLHISQEEQRKRLLKRIDDPKRNWKFNLSDIKEREYWPDYIKAYETCITETSTPETPWYVVPADDKENARLIVSQIILDTLREMKLTYPKINATREKELLKIRKQLES